MVVPSGGALEGVLGLTGRKLQVKLAVRAGRHFELEALGGDTDPDQQAGWMSGQLLRHPHGFEGLGMVPVRLCADQLRIMQQADHRDVSGPYDR